MTQFKTGDRVRYVGNDKGKYYNPDDIGTTGVFLRYDDNYRGESCAMIETGTGERNVYAYNLSLDVVVDPITEVLNKYVAEFDKIVEAGTSVERYTALGFLTAFATDLAAAGQD